MYKYLSVIAALLGIIVFYTRPLPYSGWFSVAAVVFGCGYGLISLLKERDSMGKLAFRINMVVMVILLSGIYIGQMN